jgi:hypothetical protein
MNQQTALITGASSGIGYEFARTFASHGYNVVLVARGEAKLRELAQTLEPHHAINATVLPTDLAQPAAPDELATALQTQGIQIDVLVNNVGFASYGFFHELDLAKELSMIQVNIVALTHLTRLFLPGMVARRQGRILNVASTAAFQPGPLMAVYYASKAFVLSFSEAIANELAESGVTVTALCPGPTQSGFQERAAMQDSKLVQSGLMTSAEVVRQGYEGLMQGKPVVIPGLNNKIGAFATRFVPRQTAVRIVRRMQERTGH